MRLYPQLVDSFRAVVVTPPKITVDARELIGQEEYCQVYIVVIHLVFHFVVAKALMGRAAPGLFSLWTIITNSSANSKRFPAFQFMTIRFVREVFFFCAYIFYVASMGKIIAKLSRPGHNPQLTTLEGVKEHELDIVITMPNRFPTLLQLVR